MLIGGSTNSLYFYKRLFICLMILLDTEKIEARRSGQKDGGGESVEKRSRNVEEVLFLMDPEWCRTYTALNSTWQTISGGCEALITEKLWTGCTS